MSPQISNGLQLTAIYQTLCTALVVPLISTGVSLSLFSGNRVQAQVTPDGTLSTTVTSSDQLNFVIEGGEVCCSSTRQRPDANLFHSFDEFSVPTGGSAHFNNTADIGIIFSRVTGGNLSNIDGRLSANGPADLFLMNPNGIVFGKNASLDIGGSFIGTTAESFVFADGVEFSTTESATIPLLSLSLPVGLQMGQNPGHIYQAESILQTTAGQTLALVGGDITLAGGTIEVPGGKGRIELISVGADSMATVQPVGGRWRVDTDDVSQFANLILRDEALVLGNGNGNSSIQLIGDAILATDSQVESFNLGYQRGGGIVITSVSTFEVKNSDFTLAVQAEGDTGHLRITAPIIRFLEDGGVGSIVTEQGTGNGGNLIITGDRFTMMGPDAGFGVSTMGAGNSGDVVINVGDIIIRDSAGFGVLTEGSGNSGNVTIRGQRMVTTNESGGGMFARSSGNAGDLNIAVDTFHIDGSSGYGLEASDSGNAGNVMITADQIILQDDSGFSTNASGSGSGGDITLKARYIELDNSQMNARTSGTQTAGDLTVYADTLRVLNGGQLNVSTLSDADAGNVTIQAQTVELNAEPTTGALARSNTGINSSVLQDDTDISPIGDAGDITVEARHLIIRDGAFISSSATAGSGNGGAINIQVEALEILNGGQILTVAEQVGNAGDIAVIADEYILLSGQDVLFAERQAAYRPTPQAAVQFNVNPFSGIFGNALVGSSGDSGSVNFNTPDLHLENGAIASVSAAGTGDAGNLMVDANTALLQQQASIQSEATAGSQGNVVLNLEQALFMIGGSRITTNATGSANGGNILIQAPISMVGLQNSDIIASAIAGDGGNIRLNTQGLIGFNLQEELTAGSDITASSQIGLNGRIEISSFNWEPDSGFVELPSNLPETSDRIVQGCAMVGKSRFVMLGRGGLVPSPLAETRGDRPWFQILPDFGPIPDVGLVLPKVPDGHPIPSISPVPSVSSANVTVDATANVAIAGPNSHDPNPLPSNCSFSPSTF